MCPNLLASADVFQNDNLQFFAINTVIIALQECNTSLYFYTIPFKLTCLAVKQALYFVISLSISGAHSALDLI